DAITAATGYAPVTYAAVVLAAWRGDESRALTTIDIDVNDATLRGEGTVLALAGHAKAVLYNGLGRHDVALQAAREVCAHDDDLTFVGWSLAELVEAAARSGEHDEAVSAMARLEARTGASGTDWAL